MARTSNSRLNVRLAIAADVPQIANLIKRAYPSLPPYKSGELQGQINNYPEGQFVAVLDDKIVGYCASQRISGDLAMVPHD